MISFPNAKINLGLHVTEKRPDGFHNLETVFYPLPLSDMLEFVISGETSLRVTGIEIDSAWHENLVYKAYSLLNRDFGLYPLAVHLHKQIPSGAGLGGGSSDAAFMLKMLNENFRLGLSHGQLEAYARQLGSDCAFFIQNKPMLAFGKGDELEDFSLDLSGKFVLLAKPPVHVSTKDAYGGIRPKQPEFSLKDILSQPITEWKTTLVNDFETTIFVRFPEIERVKKQLYEMGAVYASMSGSGSSVFGIFNEKPEENPKINAQQFVLGL